MTLWTYHLSSSSTAGTLDGCYTPTAGGCTASATDNATYVYPNATTIPDAWLRIPITYTDSSWVSNDTGITLEPETEEQKQARLKKEAESKKAKLKADELLKSHIGTEAFGKLHEVGYFELDSRKYQGRKYRVPNRSRGLIEVLEGDKVIDRLCIHPTRSYPDGDEILTRLVLLECAEEELLKVAHHNPADYCVPDGVACARIRSVQF